MRGVRRCRQLRSEAVLEQRPARGFTQGGDWHGAQPGPEFDERAHVIGGVIGVVAVIIVAAVLVMGFWKPGFFVTTKLDVNAAQTGVQQNPTH